MSKNDESYMFALGYIKQFLRTRSHTICVRVRWTSFAFRREIFLPDDCINCE